MVAKSRSIVKLWALVQGIYTWLFIYNRANKGYKYNHNQELAQNIIEEVRMRTKS
jgi:hypothetical protein